MKYKNVKHKRHLRSFDVFARDFLFAIIDIFGNNQQISRKDRKERKAEENCRTDNISLYSFASSAPFAGTFFYFQKCLISINYSEEEVFVS